MRPEILFPLFSPVSTLRGVGDAIGKKLAKMGAEKPLDLILLRPHSVIDRRNCPPIPQAEAGTVASFVVKVIEHRPPRRKGLPYVVECLNGSGFLQLVFFHYQPYFLENRLQIAHEYLVSGRIERNGAQVQMHHPDYILPPAQAQAIMRVEPQYPLTAGISQAKMQNFVAQSLARLPDNLPEWQLRPQLSFIDAIRQLHNPQNPDDLAANSPAILRLAFDELLAKQVLLAKNLQQSKISASVKTAAHSQLASTVIAALPFELTAAQQNALAEISADMQSGTRMLRLLQGDVGSGKTIVALLAMLSVVEAGQQCFFMMPSTLLAKQQLAAITQFCSAINLNVAMLSSAIKGKQRAQILAKFAAGEIQILVGTHSVFRDEVMPQSLGLVVIDEQHRFGVEQRLRLCNKNPQAHVLLMSATPIPRTLTIAFYGDMQVSRIMQKPKNRQKITTAALPLLRLPEIYSSIERALANGEKIYLVCPLVEESEKLSYSNVLERFAELEKRFIGKVGLVHGKMKQAEKDDVLQRFLHSQVQILVATTVIEVGIDVPDATVIIIENAEKFGLAQLHQLRGRVGRGSKASTCLLVYAGSLSKTAQKRLQILKNCDDGFEIAEADLRLRGSGDVLGTQQSGEVQFCFAELCEHENLLEEAQKQALELTKNLPTMPKSIEFLLELFGYSALEKLIAPNSA